MDKLSINLRAINEQHTKQFKTLKVVLSFQEYLKILEENPIKLTRNAARYLKDAFEYFGTSVVDENIGLKRFKLFDVQSSISRPIIGCEQVQQDIYNILCSFEHVGFANKLILLHGPNGSAKTSIVESISNALEKYSETDDGVVYTFNWIFPIDKVDMPLTYGEVGPIGFASSQDIKEESYDSFAFLEETKIASKIPSEFKDNPVYLIPMPYREQLLKEWFAKKQNCDPNDIELPPHLLLSGLSHRNQLIFKNLLAAYGGNLLKVYRHIQVERFFYSRQYRVGISTIEPQMHIDAQERQLTLEKNLANIPVILQNIRFSEVSGELVEANRGILEFSDILKRPIETFKYLLSTAERTTLHLPSSNIYLDSVFIGTTNEQHLDAFKTMPDFASFRSRFVFIKVPYLLKLNDELKIYDDDVKAITKYKKIVRHSMECLCEWAIMTRLRQPNPDFYNKEHQHLITKLDPYSKLKLYNATTLQPIFTEEEESILKGLKNKIMNEAKNTPLYEGRFGASPREIKHILYRAVHNTKYLTITPITIFEEISRIIEDKSIYEFLQFEPRGAYHNVSKFLDMIKNNFVSVFTKEVLIAMNIIEEEQYNLILQRYIDNVVAYVKKEKLYNNITKNYEEPSIKIMNDIEDILEVTDADKEKHRQDILQKIAAYKIENRAKKINIFNIFHNYLSKIKDYYQKEQQKLLDSNYKVILSLGTANEFNLTDKEKELALNTLNNLDKKFGYDEISAKEIIKFVVSFKKE